MKVHSEKERTQREIYFILYIIDIFIQGGSSGSVPKISWLSTMFNVYYIQKFIFFVILRRSTEKATLIFKHWMRNSHRHQFAFFAMFRRTPCTAFFQIIKTNTKSNAFAMRYTQDT